MSVALRNQQEESAPTLSTKRDRRAQRVNLLAEALTGAGALHLRDAAQLMGVSAMTVRRDIALAPGRFGYFGGYIVARAPEAPYVMAQELGAHSAAKAAICARAAEMIEDDDTIFIDCGTTMPHLAKRIPPRLNVTVVCYALNIAAPLATSPNVRLIMLGGLYNPSSASFAVEDGLATLRRLGINKAFISAGGVHAQKGVSCSNFHEVAVKQAVLRMALERCLVVDGSKLGKMKPAPFAELNAFDTLLTTESDQARDVQANFHGRFIII
jgi:DeoR family deoxyribose operon repressor